MKQKMFAVHVKNEAESIGARLYLQHILNFKLNNFYEYLSSFAYIWPAYEGKYITASMHKTHGNQGEFERVFSFEELPLIPKWLKDEVDFTIAGNKVTVKENGLQIGCTFVPKEELLKVKSLIEKTFT